MPYVWIVLSSLFVDQVSKWFVRDYMELGESVQISGNIFRLTYIHNPGAAFGFNLGSPLLHTVLSILALGVLIFVFANLSENEMLRRCALCLVLGGALGNIVDRIYLGEVVDFFDVGWGELRWPIFNFADAFVTIGVFILIFHPNKDKKETDDTSNSYDSNN